MKDSFILGLLQNISVLLAFSYIVDYFWTQNESRNAFANKIIAGIIIGIATILLILTPWTFKTGVFFDTRSVLLAISGLFFGVLPTVLAMLIAALYRLYEGGAGQWMGIAVVLSSGTIGLLWGRFRPDWKKNPTRELIWLGFLVHLVMVGCAFLLPFEMVFQTLEKIFLAVLIIYPLATILLGKLILKQIRNWENKIALNISEERWRFALEGAGDGLWDWDAETGLVFFSDQWKNMLGYAPNEIRNDLSEWKKLIHPDDLDRVMNRVDKMQNMNIDYYESEYRLLCKDGTYKWILDRGKVMEVDSLGFAKRSIGTHKDITERKRTEKELKESKEYLNSILKTIPDLIFMFDKNGNFVDCQVSENVNLFVPLYEFLYKNVTEVMPDEIGSKTLQAINEVIKTGKQVNFEYDLVLPNGINYFEALLVLFSNDRVLAVVRNTTRTKESEMKLKQSREQLKSFAAHLQYIRENERQLLSNEIHDELGQTLVAMKIDLGLLGNKVSKIIPEGKQEQVLPEYQRLAGFIDKSINTTRKIMTELHPEVLDLLGFSEAANVLLHKFQERTGVVSVFQSNVRDINLNQSSSVAVYHIFNEIIENIEKHAGATNVIVNLTKENGRIVLEVKDDGVGFDAPDNPQEGKYGILGMYERAYSIDGEVFIKSEKGVGTTVILEIDERNDK